MGYVEYATIIEELSRVDGSVGISSVLHTILLCSNHIYSSALKSRSKNFLFLWLLREPTWRLGLTEPARGFRCVSELSLLLSEPMAVDG